MQKKCKPNAMELAPIAEMQPFFYKNTIFLRINDENINLFALGVLFL